MVKNCNLRLHWRVAVKQNFWPFNWQFTSLIQCQFWVQIVQQFILHVVAFIVNQLGLVSHIVVYSKVKKSFENMKVDTVDSRYLDFGYLK